MNPQITKPYRGPRKNTLLDSRIEAKLPIVEGVPDRKRNYAGKSFCQRRIAARITERPIAWVTLKSELETRESYGRKDAQGIERSLSNLYALMCLDSDWIPTLADSNACSTVADIPD
jgi:hypothetical protein